MVTPLKASPIRISCGQLRSRFHIRRYRHRRVSACALMALASSSLLGFLAQSTPKIPKERQKIIPSLVRCVKEAWQETRTDLSTRWPLFFLVLWFAGLIAVQIQIILGLFSVRPSTSACRPDGTFSPFDDYTYWDASGFFQINLGFGSFTFTEAKIIDIVWDIVIGRLGQGILAFFSWRTFADYVAVHMETAPMTYTAFIVLFMQDGPSFMSILRMVRDFALYRRLRSKVSTAWVILSMLFILAWPTLIAAMSGYSPKVGAYVKDVDQNFVPYDDFRLLSYIVHDGWRINLTGDYPVPAVFKPDGISVHDVLLSKVDGSPRIQIFYSINCGIPTGKESDLCYLQRNLSDYISHYGFDGGNETPSQWLNHTLPSHSLDIEPFAVPHSVFSSLNMTRNFQPAWTYANHTYTLRDMQDNGGCKPLGESFQWGFSYIQLFIVVLLLTIWTSCTCILRHRTRLFLPLQDQPERPRGLRAVLLLAEAIKSELEASGINPHTLTNKRLKRQINKQLKGGSISFGLPPTRRNIHTRRNLMQWVKRDLVWLITAATFAVFSYFVSPPIVFPILSLLILWAYFVGTTTKSRLFLATCLVSIPLIFFFAVFF
ncbi:hypothetical protein HD806DRAFT_479848 [Xylariaceae sp. AK1471]|nr:hypothetical protein HD806DRAFT_479848 [Xylariaceae sp. AK1471]